MKSNTRITSFFSLFAKATCLFLLISMLASASVHTGKVADKHPQPFRSSADLFQAQLQRYINIYNLHELSLKKGIVMISFFVNDNNQLSEVVAYSQNRALDLYLVSCLQGKKVKATHVQKNQKRYLKIRFNIPA